jgi:hypothetical protein
VMEHIDVMGSTMPTKAGMDGSCHSLSGGATKSVRDRLGACLAFV